MRLLFEGGYYSGCGYYSSKYGIYIFGARALFPDIRCLRITFDPPGPCFMLYTYTTGRFAELATNLFIVGRVHIVHMRMRGNYVKRLYTRHLYPSPFAIELTRCRGVEERPSGYRDHRRERERETRLSRRSAPYMPNNVLFCISRKHLLKWNANCLGL